MPDLDVSLIATRTELTLGNLELNESPYKLTGDGFDMGDMTWDRVTTESPFVDGRVLVAAKKGERTGHVRIRSRRNTMAELNASILELIDVFEQSTYTLEFRLSTVLFASWSCEPADYSLGEAGVLGRFELMHFQQVISFEVPYFLNTDEGYM